MPLARGRTRKTLCAFCGGCEPQLAARWRGAAQSGKVCRDGGGKSCRGQYLNHNLETESRISTLVGMARNFKDLTEREILALAVSLEEEDGRVYADFADGLRETYPATAKLFDDMGAEESGHRASLIATYRERFGEHIPLIRRQDVKGFVQRRPFWLTRPLKISEVRKQAEIMEFGDPPVLSEGDWAGDGRRHPQAARRSGRGRAQAPGGGGGDVGEHYSDGEEDRGGSAASSVRIADCAAGTGRADGWVGVDAGSGVRGGLCHQK